MSYEAWRITYQSSEQAARAAYATIARLTAEVEALREWQPIETAPEGKPVLLAIEYQTGNRRVIRAMRAGERTLHLSDEQDPWDGCIYDETEDAYFCAPGWYEKNEYDECNWMVHDKPIAWQHLPDPSTA